MMAKRGVLLAAVALIGVLSALRLIHLEADTPLNLATTSAGAYVDEGYKTLGGRNLLLHGTRKADPDWARPELRSPLSDWLFFAAFRTFGMELRSARLVTILWFLLLLAGFAYGTIKEYRPALLLLGLSLLGLLHTLFFFSRLAMFVVSATTCLYWLLFLFRRWGFGRPLLSAGLFFVTALATTFAIKITAPIYFAPVLFGLSLAWLLKANARPAHILGACLPALAAIGILTFATRDIWRHFLHFDGLRTLSNTLLNPLTSAQPFWVAVGLLCACHILLTRPREFVESPYRASLMCMVLVGPVLFAVFNYNPLRYYIPLAPAYLLLPLEWLHLRAWEWPMSTQRSRLTALGCVAILTCAILALFQALNLYLLFKIPVPLGAEPGLGDEPMFHIAAPAALIVAILVWRFRGALLTTRSSLAVVCLLAALGLGRDLWMVGGFWISPSHQAREISRRIEAVATAGAVVAGDWAPFFTLGTPLQSHRIFNYSGPDAVEESKERLRSAHPGYFLWNQLEDWMPYPGQPRWLIEQTPGMSLGRALFETTYAGKEVELYEISYDPGEPSG